jgi:hypothetical protein
VVRGVRPLIIDFSVMLLHLRTMAPAELGLLIVMFGAEVLDVILRRDLLFATLLLRMGMIVSYFPAILIHQICSFSSTSFSKSGSSLCVRN